MNNLKKETSRLFIHVLSVHQLVVYLSVLVLKVLSTYQIVPFWLDPVTSYSYLLYISHFFANSSLFKSIIFSLLHAWDVINKIVLSCIFASLKMKKMVQFQNNMKVLGF